MKSVDYAENIYWMFGLLIKPEYHIDAVTVVKELEKMGIGCRTFFYPMHLQPVFQKEDGLLTSNILWRNICQKRGFIFRVG